jgi:hypothetical protein
VLEIGAGRTNTDLGLPVEPGQGDLSEHDPSLVNVDRTDVQKQLRPGVGELDATEPIPPAMRNQDAVIINNPYGYTVDIANIGSAVKPGGRIVIQGRAQLNEATTGVNKHMDAVLQHVLRGELPPGYELVDIEWLPDVPSGDRDGTPKPPQILGGPFNLTSGRPASWPNVQLVIERVPVDPTSPETVAALGESIDQSTRAVDALEPEGVDPNARVEDFKPPPIYEIAAPKPPEAAGTSGEGPVIGEAITPERLRETYGMPEENAAKFREICKKHNVVIDVRPTTKAAPDLLDQGALPKMEDLKAKTIDAEDLSIGARQEDVGKVGYFKPRPPERTPGMTDEAWGKIVKRYAQRDAEYWDNARRMTELQRPAASQRAKGGPMDDRGTHQDTQVAVDEAGAVSGVTGEGGELRESPFTGDHDVFDIRKADGSPLSSEEYEEIVSEMKSSKMGVAHGAHMRWVPKTPSEMAIFDAIVRRHASGAEPLIRFQPDAPPTTAKP